MAKKFLYFIAVCIVIFLVGRIGYAMYEEEIARFVFVPSAEFTPQEPLEANAYEDPALWISRPGKGVSDPARWQPAYAPQVGAEPGAQRAPSTPGAAPEAPDFAVFFIHPTSYLSRDNWNASIGEESDAETDRLARVYVRGMASPFNAASQIWAPRYRQATMGAFLTDQPEAQAAIDAAYADVREAYRFFLDTIGEDTPVVLAGHSQGSLHLLRLLREEVMPGPVAERLVAAYAVGWPVSVEHDLPVMAIPACATALQTGCLMSWSSFAEPADPSAVIDTYAASMGFDGTLRGDSQILCTNPLTGEFGGAAPASANLGTLVPDDSIENGELVPAGVPARCDDRGLLMIGDPPELGSYVLPGNNYHVYDYPLFWANTQADVVRRAKALVGADAASEAEAETAS
ncbi:MAG: DUF3089 domain-containing protein [Erythrobacter sp.]|uniref:DUF3089 domain-containing protein n=1 Tax=Erythrobacter sp. TaxID=1042 RepID=UPI002638FAD1|nr:DUF3089 domain-containing protein [Erythrobacter sp.]MDJ0977050.1 DUF3089 domain-containing protein [Erythrobacter sp.]